MRRLLPALALLLVGCSDDAAPGPTTTSTVPVTVEAVRTCGPDDRGAITVEVTGVDARTVDLVLVPGGVVVPYAADRTTIAADAGIEVTEVRIREPGGPVLAIDRTIGPNTSGGCG